VAGRTARFLEEAAAELLEALAYYNERTPGAGDRLLEDVLATTERLCEDPLRYAVESDGCRRWRLVVFPYSLRYELGADGNVDIVVAHDRRRPGYFRGRTNK